ncbi:MAG: ferritin-like domain-containing protein [Pseudomonadota bacterium]|nr:ferritin-like domain-containing protein [Pseudomonadota bacterium]
MPIESMEDLYVALLEDSYDSEKQIVKALPKMAQAAEAPELKEAFKIHLEETTGQVERLEEIFGMLEVSPRNKTCDATKALIKEANDLITATPQSGVKDAGLIANAQKVEHYEIASYGTLCEFAKLLGFDDQAELLEETLNEEKATDKKLTALAEGSINELAEAA